MATNRQNKPKLHKFQFCIKYWELFRVNSSARSQRIHNIIGIFKGSKRVTMATEFKQTSAKLHWFQFSARNRKIL